MITAETLKRWGCRDWTDEERQYLADQANEARLVEPENGVWPELKTLFDWCMA